MYFQINEVSLLQGEPTGQNYSDVSQLQEESDAVKPSLHFEHLDQQYRNKDSQDS